MIFLLVVSWQKIFRAYTSSGWLKSCRVQEPEVFDALPTQPINAHNYANRSFFLPTSREEAATV